MLRGLAAIAVCLCHFCKEKVLGPGWVVNTAEFGRLGVDAFFVISGYVIPMQLRQRNFDYSLLMPFLKNRFIRLYPACAIGLVLSLVMWKIQYFFFKDTTPPDMSGWKMMHNFLLTARILDLGFYNTVAWTLGVELQYYLLLALSFPLLFSKNRWVSDITLLGWIAISFFIPSGVPEADGLVQYWTPLFVVGISLFQFHDGYSPKLRTLVFVIAGLAVTTYHLGFDSSITVAISTAVILTDFKRIWKPFIFLGTISYSIYLVHLPIGDRFMPLGRRLVGIDSPWMYLFLLMALGSTVVTAYFFYKYIEAPCHTWSKKVWRKRPDRTTADSRAADLGTASSSDTSVM